MPADVIVTLLVFVLLTRISFGSRHRNLFPATKILKWMEALDIYFEVVTNEVFFPENLLKFPKRIFIIHRGNSNIISQRN